MNSRINTRDQIIRAAKHKDDDLGQEAMIVNYEWGYWVGGSD